MNPLAEEVDGKEGGWGEKIIKTEELLETLYPSEFGVLWGLDHISLPYKMEHVRMEWGGGIFISLCLIGKQGVGTNGESCN